MAMSADVLTMLDIGKSSAVPQHDSTRRQRTRGILGFRRSPEEATSRGRTDSHVAASHHGCDQLGVEVPIASALSEKCTFNK